jgi:hypothetical protein
MQVPIFDAVFIGGQRATHIIKLRLQASTTGKQFHAIRVNTTRPGVRIR